MFKSVGMCAELDPAYINLARIGSDKSLLWFIVNYAFNNVLIRFGISDSGEMIPCHGRGRPVWPSEWPYAEKADRFEMLVRDSHKRVVDLTLEEITAIVKALLLSRVQFDLYDYVGRIARFIKREIDRRAGQF